MADQPPAWAIQLLTALKQQNIPSPDLAQTDLYSKLNSQLSEFHYDPEQNSTFEVWYDRFGILVEEGGGALSDKSKVRLIMGKLGLKEYHLYTNSILPQNPENVPYKDLVQALKNMFSDTKSLFVRRAECFAIRRAAGQDLLDYLATVNAQCEKAQMTLSKEAIKCLIFVCGLGTKYLWEKKSTFGILVNRFRAFAGTLQLEPQSFSKIIHAAILLHNFFIENGDIPTDEELRDVTIQNPHNYRPVHPQQIATIIRNKFVYFFTP